MLKDRVANAQLLGDYWTDSDCAQCFVNVVSAFDCDTAQFRVAVIFGNKRTRFVSEPYSDIDSAMEELHVMLAQEVHEKLQADSANEIIYEAPSIDPVEAESV
jgi:hypothetical protein